MSWQRTSFGAFITVVSVLLMACGQSNSSETNAGTVGFEPEERIDVLALSFRNTAQALP